MAQANATTVGGLYSIDDLEKFLTGLEVTHGLRCDHEANGSIRVKLKSEP